MRRKACRPSWARGHLVGPLESVGRAKGYWTGEADVISPNAVVRTQKVGEGAEIREFAVVSVDVAIGARCVIHPHVVIEDGVVLEEDVEVFPGAYLGKEPKGAGATARQPDFVRGVRIGRGCSIGPHAVIYQDVKIGAHCLIGDGASIREQCRIGDYCLISRYVTINYHTTIGHHTKIMDLTHITGNMAIGSNVFISVLVATTNDNAIGTRGYSEEMIIGPHLEDGVMIGCGANLLPGISLGAGAVLGAGSVATKDVRARTLAIGSPARFVRSLE
jgi:acetyltransferase-like isoleucine patch superfamily enzyme